MTSATAMRVEVSPGVALDGDLARPPDPSGLVVFAHGSGSSRFSPRNRAVARELNRRGLATLLLDLLTAAEERLDLVTRQLRFDVETLAGRLLVAADQAGRTTGLPVGYFGASTGAGAALIAAARAPDTTRAVVSRGGRPDLAGDGLHDVRAPTLLICGGNDPVVTELNQKALRHLTQTRAELVIVPGATHLFAEPGALEQVALLAGDWFVACLRGDEP